MNQTVQALLSAGVRQTNPLTTDDSAPFGANRLFEWIAATMMLCIALTLALPGDTLERASLRPLIEAGMTEEGLGVFFAMAGVLRACALLANGRVPFYGPRARALGALAGAVIWGQMAAILGLDSFRSGLPSLVMPIAVSLVIGELLSCYRATIDVGRIPAA